MDKLVSIILPTYNGANHIKASLDSVLSQSYGNWELLVLDDGSKDNTEALIKHLAQSDGRIIYIKNESNLGVQKTLNRGLEKAKGEYVARIDDDDVWIDKNKLSKQVEFLEKNKDFVLVGTGYVAVDEKNKEIFRHLNPERDEEIRRIILNKNCFLHSSVVFRGDVVLRLGRYSTLADAKHIEDYDLWLKLGTVGKLANLATHSVKVTLRDESISSKNKILQFKQCIQLIEKYRNKYPNYALALASLSIRMVVYRFFQIKPFSYLYSSFYKLYKNI